jgi:DNA-binding IclR family transcriptional regulator
MSSKIAGMIDEKLLRIIRLFLNKPEELFHLQKISQEAKVPIGTTFRLMKKLKNIGLTEIVSVGKVKLYKLSKKNAVEFEMLR